MTEYLRVRDPGTGAEYTYSAAQIAALDLSAYVVDKPALGRDGLPKPTKLRLPLGTPLPGSAAERRQKKTTEANVLGEAAGQTSATPEEEN